MNFCDFQDPDWLARGQQQWIDQFDGLALKRRHSKHDCHSHEQFCIYQSTVFTDNSIQEVTVISQTENEQGREIDAHSWGHQFQLLTAHES